MDVTKLTTKQQRFVAVFDGNATEAALKAGYSPKTAYSIGNENLKKPEMIKAIRNRESRELQPDVADRKERQKFWTGSMRNKKLDIKDRLKASELLGRSEGDFLDRIEFSGGLDLALAIDEGRKRAGAGS